MVTVDTIYACNLSAVIPTPAETSVGFTRETKKTIADDYNYNLTYS